MRAKQQIEGRKPDIRAQRSRARLIASARQLFLDKGYDINLDEVAAHAGVVKRTVYNIFENKRSLLKAVLDGEHEAFRAAAEPYRGNDLRGLLSHYAGLYRTYALTESGVKFYRLIIGDVSQFPDMAAQVYETGVGEVVGSLAHELDLGVAAGKIRPIDTLQMAERFYAALGGLSHRRAVSGLGFDPPEFQQSYIDDTVEMFVEILSPRG